MALGVEAEDRVAIASSTRYEWALADLAVMVSGGATTTIYPTTIADDVAFILADSGAKVVFAENAEQLDKLRSIRSQTPGVSRVVVFDGQSDDDAWTLSLDDVRQLGREYLAGDPGAIDARIDRIQPDQLATIIYTSGTTGRPKGVRLRHSAWTYEAAATESINILAEDDLQYLWLPLAHVFGKVLLTLPLQIGFTTAIDGRIDKIVDNLAVVRPDLHGGGAAHLREGLRPDPDDDGRRGRPQAQAVRVGRRRGPRGQRAARAGQEPLGDARPQVRHLRQAHRHQDPRPLRWTHPLLHLRLGGAEPGRRALVRLDGHADRRGLRPHRDERGILRQPHQGLPLRLRRLGPAGHRDPDRRGRRGAAARPGCHGGLPQQPRRDRRGARRRGLAAHRRHRRASTTAGFLRITDRKKDLFKTSGGKYVAPSIIESTFKGLCPYASQLVVYGADRNFVSALITLDPDAIQGWAAQHGMEGASYQEIVTSDACREMVQGYVDQLNAGLNRWETIKKFTILESDLTVEDGELTPSLKLKRKVVAEKYQDLLDAHYTG